MLGLYKSISIVHVLDIYVLSFSVNTCLFDAPKTVGGYIPPLIQGLHPKQHVKMKINEDIVFICFSRV